MKKIFISFLVIFIACSSLYAEVDKGRIYSTWDVIELDTCASAWLIKRFVDADAEFKFYPKGEFIAEGTPFDTPDAELRRRQGESTFECIINKYNIKDPRLIEIGKLIHEIEINYWGSDFSPKGKELNDKINKIITENNQPEKKIKEAFIIMDELYADVLKYKNKISK